MFRKLTVKQIKAFDRRNVAFAKCQETEFGDIGSLCKRASKGAESPAALVTQRTMRKGKSSKLKASYNMCV